MARRPQNYKQNGARQLSLKPKIKCLSKVGHPKIENNTGLQFEPVFLADEESVPVLAPLLGATFSITKDATVIFADDQLAINLAGEFWGDAELSSYKYEPQAAFTKLATDIVVLGHAQSGTRTTSLDVGLKVGPVQKIARVYGDRYWVKQDGRIFGSKPQPFTKIPLIYERAFGGWDKADNDEKNWRFEPRNTVGMGFGDPLRFVEEGKVPIPNIEDPQHLITRYGDTPPPVGFGFISPNWQPRVQFAGTYDEEWEKTRKPLLAEDFDRRFFNAASPGLIAPGYLRGDEDVMIVNASPVPKLKFKLPGIPPPVCKIELRGGRTEVLQTNLDTVIINTDEMLVFLLWRNYMHVPNGPHDVVSIEVTTEQELQTAATV